MKREYPRFLFSDPTNTKSPGPFIVHTLSPRKIFRVHWGDSERGFILYDLQDASDPCKPGESGDIIRAAEQWLSAQLKCGVIKNPMKISKDVFFQVGDKILHRKD
jgi:hypothetical protein